jgi:hypothetical protein
MTHLSVPKIPQLNQQLFYLQIGKNSCSSFYLEGLKATKIGGEDECFQLAISF